jgi:hypothetical protein
VRVNRKRDACRFTGPADDLEEPGAIQRPAALRGEHVVARVLPQQLPEAPQDIPLDWLRAVLSILQSLHAKLGTVQVDLIPA